MGEAAPSRLGRRWSVVALAVLSLLAGCSNADRLEMLRSEVVLNAPDDAVELARTEVAGTSAGFGRPRGSR